MDDEKYLRKDLYEADGRWDKEKHDALDKRIDDLNNFVSIAFAVLAASFALGQIVIAVVLYLITR